MENKYSLYRDIRYKRTFRTIGKMSWWRIVLGIVLIVYVLLVSGIVSQQFAAREKFAMAEKLMISPNWMEKYKPDTKAFIEAGVLYQEDKLEEALAAFEKIENFEAADVMESRCLLKLAADKLETGEFEESYKAIASADTKFLTEQEIEQYIDTCKALSTHFEGIDSAEAEECVRNLSDLIAQCSEA